MKVSSIGINQIFAPKAINRIASTPIFRAKELSNDVFIRTTKTPELSEYQERKNSLPKYLYHFTNKSSYEKIIETGEIKLSKDVIDGIFMFDMKDFQTNWRNTPSKNSTLAKDLFEQALKSENGLILLKIPTENLDPMKIAIRPEDEVTEFLRSDHFRNLAMVYAEKGGIFNNKWELPKDLVEGHSPVEAKSYTDNNRAVEYIFQGNIDLSEVPIEKVLEIPEINIKNLKKSSEEELSDLFSLIEENA